MSDTTIALQSLRIFSGLDDQVYACSHLWTPRTLPAGESLWWHGAPADELAILVGGEIRARIQALEVGRVGAGNLLGEAAGWSGSTRTATLSAITDCELLILRAEKLEELRALHPAIYERLQDHALSVLARRIHEVDRRIARLADGTQRSPERQSLSSLARLVRRLSQVLDGTLRRSPEAVLRRLPGLDDASAVVITEISSAMTAQRVEAGDALWLEADPGESIFVLAQGTIDVLRNVGQQKATRLATLKPVALLGTGALLLRERRNASCVASERCVLFEMDRKSFLALRGEAGQVWRKAILSALHSQLSGADTELARLKQGGEEVLRSDYERVQGHLAGYQKAPEASPTQPVTAQTGATGLRFQDPWDASDTANESWSD